MLFTPSHDTNLLPINQISCKMLCQQFFASTIYFSRFCCSCHNFFQMCFCHQIQNESIFFLNFKMSHFQLMVSFYSLLRIKNGFIRFANHWILFLFAFNTAPKLFGFFWNWGRCIIIIIVMIIITIIVFIAIIVIIPILLKKNLKKKT